MGDHRCSIKIEWSMHGHTEKADMWWNYHPTDDCFDYKVDQRLLEWLTTQYDKSMERWHDMQDEAEDERMRERRAKMTATERRIEDLRREADELERTLKAPGTAVR